MSNIKSVAVVVPVHNRRALTERFLNCFIDVEYENYKIVIIDDGSTDGTAEWLENKHSQVKVLKGNGNLWWTGATNLGVEYALENNFDFVLTINNDAVLHPKFLSKLVESAGTAESNTDHAGYIVGCCLYNLGKPEQIWTQGVRVDWCSGRMFDMRPADAKVDVENSKRLVAADVVTGCGVLIPTECFRRAGLFDRRWFPHYHADSEFCLRARKHGYHSVVDLDAIAWYDCDHSWMPRPGHSLLFSVSSPYFWKPVVALHARYCPPRYFISSLVKHYVRNSRLSKYCGWLLKDQPTVAR